MPDEYEFPVEEEWPSVSPSPSAGYQGYTRGDENVLPVNNDTDLETDYSAGDLVKVATKDEDVVPQTATQQFMIHMFKDYVGANTQCTLEWQGQTTLLPSSSTVYLQIFKRTTTEWIEVDNDTGSSINTDFILTGTVADLTDYKDGNNVISCRVYQEAL